MNVVLHICGMVAAALLTWCLFLPPVNFVVCVAVISIAVLTFTTIKQFFDWF